MKAVDVVIDELKLLATAEHFSKLSHFGINDSTALGVKLPLIRRLAKKIGKDHKLAIELWESGIHEARMLATVIADSKQLTEEQFDSWVSDFNSWDLCDISVSLLAKSPFVEQKIIEYSTSSEEFIKRTAFSLMCQNAVHASSMTNECFFSYFYIIEREAWDDRNFVRKAVSWALRQIGKRNEILRLQAIFVAERIAKQGTKSAKWIAKDALRELNDEKIISRTLRSKK